MGSKYASYHILRNEKYNDFELLKSIYKTLPAGISDLERAADVFSNPYVREQMKRFLSLYKSPVIILLSSRFISVYDAALSFSTINSETKKISKKLSAPILYLSNFDDDVLLFGCVQSGKTIARKHIGQGLAEYGIKPVKSTVHLLRTMEGFDFLQTDALFETTDNVNECEASIENEFHIIKKLTGEEFEKQIDCFKIIEDNEAYRVVSKV